MLIKHIYIIGILILILFIIFLLSTKIYNYEGFSNLDNDVIDPIIRTNAIKYYKENSIVLDKKNKYSISENSTNVKVITLNIFTTWNNKDLLPDMKIDTELIKNTNPEFKYYLYDEDDCRSFIKQYFDKDVLDSYDKLIPNSYKSDLWRFCILYIYGGVYLDIKFVPSNDFKFIYLTDKEYFGLDKQPALEPENLGVYTGLIICKPKNEILLNCINMIVKNVKIKYYGNSSLSPTGPFLLGRMYFNKYSDCNEIKWFLTTNDDNTMNIVYNNNIILHQYSTYRKEQSEKLIKIHYGDLWNQRKIYLE